MSEKTIQSLTIRSTEHQPGVEYKWSKLSAPEFFIKNIEIPELNSDKEGATSINLGSIVSGMPSVFARANLFKIALESLSDTNIKAKGMLSFYNQLISEWRGFLSCIALNYSDLSIDRVFLKYSDGKSLGETENIYEPLGAFGNVLFDRKKLWIDQTRSENQPDNFPFIDVISYKGSVVGGTSPESFIFTSVSYHLDEKQVFLRNGKFVDPLESDLNPKELNILYGYCKHLLKKISGFRKHFSNLQESDTPNYSNLINNLEDWANGMLNYSRQKGWQNPVEKTPEIALFESPFNIIFNYSTQLFGLNGVISDDENQEGAIAFNPEELLLPESSQILQIGLPNGESNPDFLKNHPILFLKAERTDRSGFYAYFGLPLSTVALSVFDNHMDAICGLKDDSHVKSRIIAFYDPSGEVEKLNVTLKIVDRLGKDTEIKRTYSIGGEITGKDLVLWPDFISKQWQRYFLYSELPHNGVQFQATPFVGDKDDPFFRIIRDNNGLPEYIVENGRVANLPENNKAQLLIESNYKVANSYKYEVYESNQPYKGIKFSIGKSENICGFALVRYDELGTINGLPKNWLTNNDRDLVPANLGVDFGSTNSSIAYWSESDPSRINRPFRLKNRRVSLLTDQKSKNYDTPSEEKELFFFQGEEVPTNAIKSVLTLHDYKRIANSASLVDNQLMEKDIVGGFPCFSRNLPIETSNENRHILNLVGGAGITELVHNMKWSNKSIDKSHKTAYLRTLILHVYAQLFEENHEPVSIKWSYPSSMPKALLHDYFGIYKNLEDVSPIVNGKKMEIYRPSDLEIENDKGETPWGTAEDNEINSNAYPNNDSVSTWNLPTNNDTSTSWDSEVSSEWERSERSSETSGWGSNRKATKKQFMDIKTDTGPLNFQFKELGNNESLTEACAVANYFLLDYPVRPGELLLIFDIGGSTTDISVICPLDGGSKAMIKQNSIRFAAQRIAQATGYSKNFQSVLLRVCEKKKFKLSGLHTSPYKYNKETAPFYFEQIVDRLDDSDYGDFYKLIAAECKELMIVNLYVTGLIMYYAGQLTFKLRNEIMRSEDFPHKMKNYQPKINIAFAGKGARIFDWLEAGVNAKTARDYFTQMFIRGIGGENIARSTISPIDYTRGIIININHLKKDNNSDVKYEVSKGLAIPTFNTRMLVPENKQAIEILGEEGFCVYTSEGDKKYLGYGNSVTSEMMEFIGDSFVCSPPDPRRPCPKFMDFAYLFNKVSHSLFGLDVKENQFLEAFANMNIESYIKQDPDYIEAKKNRANEKKFDYVAPIIILEGMKFYEKYLLEWMKK
ncbi:MAG: hypothetical protein J0L60_14840 [Ignavibacteria bacterium]|nr:hypothetical protein [Ignavibacteria bacterium]